MPAAVSTGVIGYVAKKGQRSQDRERENKQKMPTSMMRVSLRRAMPASNTMLVPVLAGQHDAPHSDHAVCSCCGGVRRPELLELQQAGTKTRQK